MNFCVLGFLLFIMKTTTSLTFPRRLPVSRLGKQHDSLQSFEDAVLPSRPSPPQQRQSKAFTLVVVTADRDIESSSKHRILLGMKNRGFGKGMYNSFGGKLEDGETVEECACRELHEETNIEISVREMTEFKVGIQRYTFEKDPVEMIMHVFRIHLNSENNQQTVVGCDEITPQWFDELNGIPLDNMFADDSLWLTTLLSSAVPVQINGSYHFRENCQETNTILHYYMEVKPTSKYSLEQRLFHALHDNNIHSPSIKEFKESYAFCNAVRNAFSTRHSRPRFDVVIDVAGGHGALAALFLICTTVHQAVVVDPANVGKGGVMRAWGKDFIGNHQELRFRHECLRTGLPVELENALTMTTRDRILVVACHACQHLTEDTLNISCHYGVHVAVMPCCQKDHSAGSSWKSTSKNLSIPVAPVMDLLQCGKIMALGTYDVRMKVIDPKITPQNRIICCRTLLEQELSSSALHQERMDRAHSRLELVYQKAHQSQPRRHQFAFLASIEKRLSSWPFGYTAMGFAAGVASAVFIRRR
jgi:8-oxo-dGTP pyrophosphatase MutT (NUDIX family)